MFRKIKITDQDRAELNSILNNFLLSMVVSGTLFLTAGFFWWVMYGRP